MHNDDEADWSLQSRGKKPRADPNSGGGVGGVWEGGDGVRKPMETLELLESFLITFIDCVNMDFTKLVLNV